MNTRIINININTSIILGISINKFHIPTNNMITESTTLNTKTVIRNQQMSKRTAITMNRKKTWKVQPKENPQKWPPQLQCRPSIMLPPNWKRKFRIIILQWHNSVKQLKKNCENLPWNHLKSMSTNISMTVAFKHATKNYWNPNKCCNKTFWNNFHLRIAPNGTRWQTEPNPLLNL